MFLRFTERIYLFVQTILGCVATIVINAVCLSRRCARSLLSLLGASQCAAVGSKGHSVTISVLRVGAINNGSAVVKELWHQERLNES
jgi:hypothetical protein